MPNKEKEIIEIDDTQVSGETTECVVVEESKKQKVQNFIKKHGKKLGVGVGAGVGMILCYALGKKSGHNDLEAMDAYVDGDYTIVDDEEPVEEN